MSEKDLSREFKRLEHDMHEAARNLEFEKAAELRDKLKQLRAELFGVVEEDKVADAPSPAVPSPASGTRAGRRTRSARPAPDHQ